MWVYLKNGPQLRRRFSMHCSLFPIQIPRNEIRRVKAWLWKFLGQLLVSTLVLVLTESCSSFVNHSWNSICCCWNQGMRGMDAPCTGKIALTLSHHWEETFPFQNSHLDFLDVFNKFQLNFICISLVTIRLWTKSFRYQCQRKLNLTRGKLQQELV